jgi:beta-glucanase (GH16 family)
MPRKSTDKRLSRLGVAVILIALLTAGAGLIGSHLLGGHVRVVVPTRRIAGCADKNVPVGPPAPPSAVPDDNHLPAALVGQVWRESFADDFSGSKLSTTWSTCWCYSLHGCSNGDGEGEWYRPENVKVASGYLDLTADDRSVQGKEMTTGAPRTYAYSSGMVTSEGRFAFRYGFVQWRAEEPSGAGLWPALWMMPEDGSWPPEIDALETIGSAPDVGNFTYHPTASDPPAGFSKTIPHLDTGWHTFGVDWEPHSITWYVDGHRVTRTTDAVTGKVMYLVMDLAVGGSFPGYPDGSTSFPASLGIDSVAVWQHR